jgi:hypothetical protein
VGRVSGRRGQPDQPALDSTDELLDAQAAATIAAFARAEADRRVGNNGSGGALPTNSTLMVPFPNIDRRRAAEPTAVPSRCRNGHPLTPENISFNGGRWRCRLCGAERAAAFRARRTRASIHPRSTSRGPLGPSPAMGRTAGARGSICHPRCSAPGIQQTRPAPLNGMVGVPADACGVPSLPLCVPAMLGALRKVGCAAAGVRSDLPDDQESSARWRTRSGGARWADR